MTSTSKVDPFTQKLLERTQARKDARNKLQSTGIAQRSPLKSIQNEIIQKELETSEKLTKKRPSSEGFDSSFEKKSKNNEEDSQTKVVASSLKKRLAHLNDDLNERNQIDSQEKQREDEIEQLRNQRNKERLKQQEEERARKIQERIFGKNQISKVGTSTINKPLAKESEHQNSSHTKSKVVQTAQSAIKITETDKPKPSTQKLNIQSSKESVQKDIEIASVGDKKNIFEEKMKEERLAREKELETERKLKQKALKTASMEVPDNVSKKVSENLDSGVKKDITSKVNTKHSTDELKETTSKVNTKHSTDELKMNNKNEANIKNSTDVFDVLHKQLLAFDTPPKPVVQKIEPSNNLNKEVHEVSEYSKNFTGDINSPQPIDCTDDTQVTDYSLPSKTITELSDTKAFDISGILQAANENKIDQTRNEKMPYRSSTMKSQLSGAPVMHPLINDIDLTPVKFEEEDEPSEFAKQLQLKKESILSGKEKNIKLQDDEKKFTPVKPPRLPPTYSEFLSTKPTELNEHDKENDENIPKHSKHNAKKIRRSASFSNCQMSPTKQPGYMMSPTKQSGYNKQESSKFNALSSFDKPDKEFSKKDKIQSLLEEAAYQQNIVLQTSQALNVAESSNEDKRASPEVIEGERLLLLATEKRTACLEEVRQLKEVPEDTETSHAKNLPCNASVALTDIKLPLHPDFLAALRNGKMDLGTFHFVVIASCGSRNVFSTKVVSCFDATEGSALLLNSNILLTNVPHNFTIMVRVFGLHIKKNSDPTTKVKKLHSSNQSSPGNLKSLFGKKSKEEEYSNYASPQTVFRTSNFKLVGETKISLEMLGNGGKYLLLKVPSNCPLEGTLNMRIGCKPEFTAKATGFLTILEDVGGYTAWNRRWCSLKDSKICYWKYPDDQESKEPIGSIDLRYCISKSIGLLSRDKCARPQTFELELKRSLQSGDEPNLIISICGKNVYTKYWISADNKDDRVVWMETINKHLSDSRAWLSRKSSKSIKDKDKPVPV
ncbi:anillin [Hydra vulgaris]|uniref:anillin n=1 Tax=Hydra vulgaris TaxID=6087 RepID=UPI001F5EDE0A|nr:anillin [Hydra vulgaris]